MEEGTERAFEAALRLLAQRPRGEAELVTSLRRRFPLQEVERALARLKEAGYVDDTAFARSWVEGRRASKPRAASLVQRELRAKGVAREVAQQAVHGMDDLEAALQAGCKAARRLGTLEYVAFRQKLWGYLARRGFSSGVIRRTVQRLWRPGEPEREGPGA